MLDSPKRRATDGDVSPNEAALRKLDRRDKLMRAMEALFLLLLTFMTLFLVVRLNQIADINRNNILQQKTQNEKVHAELKEYIRCIVLMDVAAARQEGLLAQKLDECAIEGLNDTKE